MSFAQGVTVVRALCVFYYEKREKMHFFRNRMRDVSVNWGNAITGKGRKCSKFVIEMVRKRKIWKAYYEKREKVPKSRNRMRDEVLKKIVLLREKV